jgi:replicative DNA helicase
MDQDKRQLRKKPAVDYSVFGRIPPQARDLEEAVLGALMLEKDLIYELLDILQPPIFYVDAHQLICLSILEMHAEREPIDILTVSHHLQSKGELEKVGGKYYISTLTNQVASSENMRSHLLIVYQKYLQRELIRNAMEVVRDSFDEITDVFALIDQQRKFMEMIDEPIMKMKQPSIVKQVDETIVLMEHAYSRKEATFGYPTGWKQLDETLSGLVPGEVTVIAARPGMGKTALAIAMANILRKAKIPTDMYSFESRAPSIIMRMMSQDLKVPYANLRKGQIDFLQVKDYGEILKQDNFSIEDTVNMYCEELENKIRMRKRTNDTQVIFIDYLQLLRVKYLARSANRENEISTISRMLKSVALDTGTAIIELAQLSRAVETRGGDKRPQLSDLRESGSIEQDADNVLFIYRPEYYKIWYDKEGYSTSGVAIIDVAKNRNGPTKDHELLYIPHLMGFEALPPGHTKKFEPNTIDKRKRKPKGPTDSASRDITEPIRDDDSPAEDLPF